MLHTQAIEGRNANRMLQMEAGTAGRNAPSHSPPRLRAKHWEFPSAELRRRCGNTLSLPCQPVPVGDPESPLRLQPCMPSHVTQSDSLRAPYPISGNKRRGWDGKAILPRASLHCQLSSGGFCDLREGSEFSVCRYRSALRPGWEGERERGLSNA